MCAVVLKEVGPSVCTKKRHSKLWNQKKNDASIVKKMERKAMSLYNKYFNEERLANKRQRRTSRALAPDYEVIYRKNLFERVKAVGEQPEPGFDAISSTSLTIATQKLNTTDPNNIDVNEFDRSIVNENSSYRNSMEGGNWKSKSMDLMDSIGENIGIIGSECNVSPFHTGCNDDKSVVSSSSADSRVGIIMPDISPDELFSDQF